jgi:hypothetical protein
LCYSISGCGFFEGGGEGLGSARPHAFAARREVVVQKMKVETSSSKKCELTKLLGPTLCNVGG